MSALFRHLAIAAIVLAPALGYASQVVINEVLAANRVGLLDEDNDSSDWLELLNAGPDAIDLAGYSLSDDPRQPRKWVLPSVKLEAGGYLLIWCSGKDRADPPAPAPPAANTAQLHSSFSLEVSGERVLLSEPGGAIADSVALPPQNEDQSFGRSPNGTGAFRYLLNPSPSAENLGPWSDHPLIVADTKFGIGRGIYSSPIDLEITCATPGAEIRYTLDGAPPTETSGRVYTGSIPISKTTVVRAAAFKPGLKPTNIDTNTYLFLDDVVLQSSQATTNAGFPTNWGPRIADYGLDPEVAGQGGADKYGGKYTATIKEDLAKLPSMSVVMKLDDLFGDRGIYSNPESRGLEWERAVSVELINPDGTPGFQADAGIRLHGGAFRRPGMTKKHSFRLLFKSPYGPSKLDYPLFAYRNAVNSFDTLVLRANHNDGWQWIEAGAHPLYIRDSFSRETMLEMGGVAPHERFVHLYLNGFYWGLYNVVERPDHSFSAAYYGGKKEDWDAIRDTRPSNGTLDAWNAMLDLANKGLSSNEAYQRIQGNDPDGTPNPEIENYLDVSSMIDFLIVEFYVGNTDWPHKNWWIGRRRVASSGFKFYLWDTELSMGIMSGLGTNQTTLSDGVMGALPACKGNAEFRMLFADHVQKHFGPGGALHVDPDRPEWDPEHPEHNVPAARFERLARTVDRAIVPESARWGDQHVAKPYTHDEHWQIERQGLLKNYLPQRSAIVLEQLRDVDLYPRTPAPTLNRYGGAVPSGFPLVLRTLAGELYYTVDGTDPRLPGGGVSPTAQKQEPFTAAPLVASGAEARLFIPKDDSLGLDWTAPDFDDSTWVSGKTGVGFESLTGYEALIAADLKDKMFNINASAYIRIPFESGPGSESLFLTLRMMYDDGYIVYLNGTRIASANAPGTPHWYSGATRSHADAEAVVFEETDVTPAAGLLRSGRNVLAIQGLNLRTNDNDFLILPELVALSPQGHEILIRKNTRVRARALAGGPPGVGEWSALTDALFVVEPPALRVSEIMYHPSNPPIGGPYAADDLEFLELENAGSKALDLRSVRLRGGVQFDFAAGAVAGLPPGGYVLVVKNLEAFRSDYETAGMLIAGEYQGKLANEGDSIIVLGEEDLTIQEFAYDDAWYRESDGRGSSLVISDASLPSAAAGEKASWIASAEGGGSPGSADRATRLAGGLQLVGDANQDGRRSISDAVRLLRRLFGGDSAPLPCGSASVAEGGDLILHDWSGDGELNLEDFAQLIAYLFQGGAPPAMGLSCVTIVGCPQACSP